MNYSEIIIIECIINGMFFQFYVVLGMLFLELFCE